MRTLVLLCAALLAAGCEDTTRLATEIPPPEPELRLTLPELGDAHPANPASPIRRGPAPAPDEFEFEDPTEGLAPPQIFYPRTAVGFEPGYAFSFGTHAYSSNIGEVTTRALVTYQGTHLGDQSATTRNYTPFLIHFGQVRKVYATAKVYTDHECGLRVSGVSNHRASWEFYQGIRVNSWGDARATSQDAPRSQDDCVRQTGSGTHEVDQGNGMVCHYLVTYDLDTYEIVSWELLFCETTGGGLI